MISAIFTRARSLSARSLRYLACLASLCAAQTASAINIMPLGDSITQGGINGTGAGYASYRYPLYFKFINAGHSVDFVGTFNELHLNVAAKTNLYPNYNTTFDRDHQADWGKKAVFLDDDLTDWLNALPASQKPDIALINIGTNDAAQGTPVATFTTQLNSIIAKLRASNPNVTVVLSNIMIWSAKPTECAAINNAIVGVVAAKNTPTSRVVLANIVTGLPAGARYDGIHPNEIGEEHLATVYYNAITPFLPPVTPPSSSAVTVDNTHATDVSIIGSWNASTVAPGYNGTNYLHDNNTGKGTKAVMFMPSNLSANGNYFVYARNIADPNRATNVPVSIVTTEGTKTVTQNQQLNGTSWNFIGLYPLSTATAEVTVSNTGTNGYVFVDAVRFLPATGSVTVDNSTTASVVTTGTWFTSSATPGYLGTNYAHDNNTAKGANTFAFKPAIPATGSYQVYARWPAEVNRATNVPIDITSSSGSITTVTVNQQVNSNTWNLLGTYTLAAANAKVTIRTTGTNGFVVADGVLVVPAPPAQ